MKGRITKSNCFLKKKKKDFSKNTGTHWKRYSRWRRNIILIVLVRTVSETGRDFQN